MQHGTAPHTIRAEAALSSAVGLIPGTAGEFVQGCLPTGEHFLVTNPIALMSEVRVAISPNLGSVEVYPPDRLKAKRAAMATLTLLGCPQFGAVVHITSAIPLGKGMASSTADIVGTVEATAHALGQHITPEQISALAITIEPSDGLMYRGIVAYNHRGGHLLERFGPVPATQQLIVDLGDSVDTIRFNRIPKNYIPTEIALLKEAYELVRRGVRQANLEQIGQAASVSARINQRLLFKPELETVMQIADKVGAYGTACAHSGAVLSLIFHPADESGPNQARIRIEHALGKHVRVFLTESVTSW